MEVERNRWQEPGVFWSPAPKTRKRETSPAPPMSGDSKIGESGGMRYDVQNDSAPSHRQATAQIQGMSQQHNQRTQAQQARRGPFHRQGRPLTLRLKAQVGATFLERRLDTPAVEGPGQHRLAAAVPQRRSITNATPRITWRVHWAMVLCLSPRRSPTWGVGAGTLKTGQAQQYIVHGGVRTRVRTIQRSPLVLTERLRLAAKGSRYGFSDQLSYESPAWHGESMGMPLWERGHLARRVPLSGLEARAPRHGKRGDEAAKRLLNRPEQGRDHSQIPSSCRSLECQQALAHVPAPPARTVASPISAATARCVRSAPSRRFLLNLIPVDVDDLPDHRKRHGFDNLDFHFNDHKPPLTERYAAVRELPDYAIAYVRSGQFVVNEDGSTTRLWEEEIRFDE